MLFRSFNEKFIGKIDEIKVKDSAMIFLVATKEASEFRNGFAHRFTPTLNDNRSNITEIDGKISLNFGRGSIIESKIIVENINNSLISLSIFMQELKAFLINK